MIFVTCIVLSLPCQYGDWRVICKYKIQDIKSYEIMIIIWSIILKKKVSNRSQQGQAWHFFFPIYFYVKMLNLTDNWFDWSNYQGKELLHNTTLSTLGRFSLCFDSGFHCKNIKIRLHPPPRGVQFSLLIPTNPEQNSSCWRYSWGSSQTVRLETLVDILVLPTVCSHLCLEIILHTTCPLLVACQYRILYGKPQLKILKVRSLIRYIYQFWYFIMYVYKEKVYSCECRVVSDYLK